MRSWQNNCRRLITFSLLMALPWSLQADSTNTPEITREEDQYLFAFDFEITLNVFLEEALNRGITLTFIREFNLTRPRWYWLDDKVVQLSQTARIDFLSLSRQYRVTLEGLGASSFDNLPEALRMLSKVRTVVDRKTLSKEHSYEAAARIRLDASQLPKPMQVNALLSKDWHWESPWIRWQFIP